MGLNEMLGRAATRRVHVLVAEMPGGFPLRAAVERELAARGWVAAQSPADADVLAVCGSPTGALADRVDAVYDQLPGPRARVNVLDPAQVGAALDTVRERLLDLAAQVTDARARGPADRRRGDAGHDLGHGEMDHDGMDHGDMEMAPAGIPLAEGAEDRDGLEMDVLHLPLGPVLRHWPPGLVVRCVLHGDVAADVEIEHLGPDVSEPYGDLASQRSYTSVEAARRVDAVASALALAGWERGASAARAARDLCLAQAPSAADALARFGRRLARARLLRWMLRGVGAVQPDAVPEALRATLAGDVHDRLLHLVDEAQALLAGATAPTPYDASDLLPGVLGGLELASVRLTVASLAPYLAPVPEAAHV